MFVIIGLGNPDKNLENTRHNIGFRAADAIAGRNGPMSFSLSNKYRSLSAEGFIGQEKILVLKPQTYMNASGQAAKAALRNFKIKPENLIVVHDDVALPCGSIKISVNHGPGGHKGVASIIQEIKSQNFARIRIGISPLNPPAENAKPDLKNFVLKNFTKEEEAALAEILAKAAKAAETIISAGPDAAMNEYNA